MSGVKISGSSLREIRQLRKELRAVDAQKEMQKANKKVAEQVVVPEAKKRASKSYTNLAGGVARAGSRGVAAIRARATQTKAIVASGKASVPWMGGSDFGSSGRYRQFPPAKEGGRFLYPVIADKQQEIVDAYWDAIDDVIKNVFPRGKF